MRHTAPAVLAPRCHPGLFRGPVTPRKPIRGSSPDFRIRPRNKSGVTTGGTISPMARVGTGRQFEAGVTTGGKERRVCWAACRTAPITPCAGSSPSKPDSNPTAWTTNGARGFLGRLDVCGLVLSSIRPLCARVNCARMACMRMRGPGPNRGRLLFGTQEQAGYSRSRLIDRLPLPVLRPSTPDGGPPMPAQAAFGAVRRSSAVWSCTAQAMRAVGWRANRDQLPGFLASMSASQGSRRAARVAFRITDMAPTTSSRLRSRAHLGYAQPRLAARWCARRTSQADLSRHRRELRGAAARGLDAIAVTGPAGSSSEAAPPRPAGNGRRAPCRVLRSSHRAPRDPATPRRDRVTSSGRSASASCACPAPACAGPCRNHSTPQDGRSAAPGMPVSSRKPRKPKSPGTARR